MKIKIILLFFLIIGLSYSEKIIHLHLVSGTVSYPFNQVDSLTFSSGMINTHNIFGAVISFQQSELDSITYSEESITGTVTDRDGNVYQTIRIGNQWWMAENLKVTCYRNNDPIPNITDNDEWKNLTTGALCAYMNNEVEVGTYGYLYNWYAISDNRNIAPEGWHVPSDEEWKELEKYLGMSQEEADNTDSRGTNEGSEIKHTSGWHNELNGTNESGFSALPGGYRYYDDGSFWSKRRGGQFWTASLFSSTESWKRILYYSEDRIIRNYDYKTNGFSIRCIKN